MCAPEDSDQTRHPPTLIRVFAVLMKKAGVLSYPLSVQRRLWSDWADDQADLSLLWAHIPFCWFWHEVAHLELFWAEWLPERSEKTLYFWLPRKKHNIMNQSFVTTYGDGLGIAGLMCGAVTFWVPPQCRVSAGLVILRKYIPMEFTIIKSRDMTLSRSPGF